MQNQSCNALGAGLFKMEVMWEWFGCGSGFWFSVCAEPESKQRLACVFWHDPDMMDLGTHFLPNF